MWKVNSSRFRVVLGFVLVMFYSSAFAQEISEQLSDFNEIKIFNGIEVELIPSEENKINITGHSKDKVKFELVENRLELRMSLENIWAEDNTLVKIFYRKLQVIDANENSVVRVKGEIVGTNLVFRAQEGASVFAAIDALKQSSKAVTGGQIHLEGKLREQEIIIHTGGQFYGKNLRSERTEVTINAGGQAEVYADDYCRATARLGGTIRIYGNPDEIDQKTTLGGSIHKMN